MGDILITLAAVIDWLSVQALPVQVAVALGVLMAAYVVWVILRVTFVALYAAFRGLG